MARYKVVDTSPRFLPVDLSRQLLPGTFEHALNYLIDCELDLTALDARFCNDATGAPAYSPCVLLKVVLFAYSRGMLSSREIERACRENVVFIALSGDSAPHFTTIAGFVRQLGDEIANVFAQVLYICDEQGLIGRDMFAIDGVKLPSNASKARSGTRAEFLAQVSKIEGEVKKMLKHHRDCDTRSIEPDSRSKEALRIERLRDESRKIHQWLQVHPEDKHGVRGGVIKSNRTDNDSAKMATDKGVIQGYAAVAAVDAKHQIIVQAQAHGSGSEQALLLPVIDAMGDLVESDSLITADAGYHSKANLEQLHNRHINALIADNDMRARDKRFEDRDKYKTKPDPLWDKAEGIKKKKQGLFTPRDFHYDEESKVCICPAGEFLYQNGSAITIQGREAVKFTGAKRVCGPCELRDQCLRHPTKTPVRQVVFFTGIDHNDRSVIEAMKQRIDSEEGRKRYGQRIATVEPVFANIRYNKGLNRFTLRTRKKVDTQWKLYCLVHNIEKLAKHGYAQ